MQEQIDAILRPFKREGYDTGAEFNGKFWEVWIGSHAGGRENGVSVAQDLAEKVRGMTVKAEPAPVPPQPLTAPLAAKPTAPQTDYDAIIAGLKAQLAEALAKAPEPVEIPEFLQDNPPAELADLFDPADTAPQSNEKLLVRLREVLGLIGLAEDNGGRAAPELYRRKDRLESGIRWNRGRLAEVI
jgi:hypothetical protein